MVWEKSSLIWNFFPWFWLEIPCFSLISLTGKSLQNFPWIPWFPWSVGTLYSVSELWLRGILELHLSFVNPTDTQIRFTYKKIDFKWKMSPWPKFSCCYAGVNEILRPGFPRTWTTQDKGDKLPAFGNIFPAVFRSTFNIVCFLLDHFAID